jgi:hypothetical protein
MCIDNAALGAAFGGTVADAETMARLGRKEECARHALSGKLAFDKSCQTVERFERRRVYLIVGNREAEVLFQRRDEIDHRDRVELGDGSQERRGGIHVPHAIADLQSAAHDLFNVID